MPVLGGSGIVIFQREAAEGLNIQSAVIRPTSNFTANSPGFCKKAGGLTCIRTAEREAVRKKMKCKVRMLYYVQGAKKKTPRGGSVRLPFSGMQCSCIQTLGGTSRKLKAVWGYVLSGNGLKGLIKQLGISLEKYYLLWKQ